MTYIIQWRRYPQDTAFFHAFPADTFPVISLFAPHFATFLPFLLTHPFSKNSQSGANTPENRNIHARKPHTYSKTTGKQGQSNLLKSRAQPVGNALPSQCEHARNRSEANRRLTTWRKTPHRRWKTRQPKALKHFFTFLSDVRIFISAWMTKGCGKSLQKIRPIRPASRNKRFWAIRKTKCQDGNLV